MSNPAIYLKDLKKSFFDKIALDGVNLDMKEGSIMGLVGKNGAGKSTMIKCILGLLKPDSGVALTFNEESWLLSPENKHRIGYVPQTASGFSWMRAGDLLDYTGAFYKHWNDKKIQNLLKEWALESFTKVGEMSEGERQKLSIIQAMGHDPDLYILDEPVASLDPVARRQFIKQLLEMNMSEGKTVLFSTHITSDLERVAADISILKDGKISYQGDLSSLKDRICKIHIYGEEELPNNLPISNLLSSKIDKQRAALTVDGYKQEEIHKLEQDLGVTVEIETLNLEEIFLELNK